DQAVAPREPRCAAQPAERTLAQAEVQAKFLVSHEPRRMQQRAIHALSLLAHPFTSNSWRMAVARRLATLGPKSGLPHPPGALPSSAAATFAASSIPSFLPR